MPFSPTGSGFLSGKVNEKSDFSDKDDVRKFVPQLALENMRANQPILEILEDFSKRKNCTNAQISMAWMLHKYPNVVPIPGSKNLERIIENLGSADVEFTQSEFEELENRLSTCRVFGHRGSVESKQNSFGNNWAKK